MGKISKTLITSVINDPLVLKLLRKGHPASGPLKRQLPVRCASSQKTSFIASRCYSTDTAHKFIDGVPGVHYDSSIISYYGTDQKQNSLFMKINRRKDKDTEIVLFLGLQGGRAYELSGHPNSFIGEIGNSAWPAAGLTIDVSQTTRRARILFNGLLKNSSQTDVPDSNPDGDIQHVRLNCIFVANTPPYLQKEYFSPNLQAKTLAHIPWNRAKLEEFPSNLDIDQAEQYGSIMAEVTFEDSSSQQLYLRGMRQSQWGKHDATYWDRNICITGTDALGTSFHARLSTNKDGVKSLQVGHIKTARDNLHPIELISFHADPFMDLHNDGFQKYRFQFSAGNRVFDATIKPQRNTLKSFFGGDPWDSKYTHCNFELMLNNTPGNGMIQVCQPYSGTYPASVLATDKPIRLNQSNDEMRAFTLPFKDQRCQRKGFVGGKGVSLAELTTLGTTDFAVPKGFCVTSNALDAHIEHYPNLKKTIDEFVAVCGGEKGDLKEHSDKVIAAFKNTSLLPAVQAEILEAFKAIDSDTKKTSFAIRSSGVGEDSRDTSFAGQNSTFFGIKSADEVMKHVVHCWASLYTPQSVQYRRQLGLPIKTSMGVCVQQMVNADAAGVMFTRHPVTGNPKEIVISSNYGLGESVVSAAADPDTITIHRSQTDALSIKSLEIGEKLHKFVLSNDNTGTIKSEVLESDRAKPSISEELALRLGQIGVALDRLYNAPRDIEWAVSKGRIYLLQCRPVTSLNNWTDFELTHELGSGAPNGSDLLTNANVTEMCSMVPTPLTLSTIIHGLNTGSESTILRRFIDDTYKHNWFVVNSKCFLNYANLSLPFPEREISLFNRVSDMLVYGHQVITPEINEMGIQRDGGPLKKRDKFKLISGMAVDIYNNPKMLKQAEQIIEHCRATSKKTENMSTKELYKWLSEMMPEFVKLDTIYNHTSKCIIFSQLALTWILSNGKKQLTEDHEKDIALLLGKSGNVVSAQVPLALQEIAQTIKQTGLSEDFKSMKPSETLTWMARYCPKAYEQVQQFIKEFGHRGIEAVELMTEPWGMKPEKFLSSVQAMMDPPFNSTETSVLSPQETVSLLKTPRNAGVRWIIQQLIPMLRSTLPIRESSKSILMEQVHLMRQGYRRLACMLAKEGRLPDRDLVFFLTHEELGDVVRAPCPNLIKKAVRRRQLRNNWQKQLYYEMNYGVPEPIVKRKLPNFAGPPRIQGTSVCNGIATGRACVAMNLEEAAAIRPGDILITRATDIGWSPYFPILAGVVTELGGLISHGAVIARENGLPCIVNAKLSSLIFKTGDTVRINGNTGTIEAVEK